MRVALDRRRVLGGRAGIDGHGGQQRRRRRARAAAVARAAGRGGSGAGGTAAAAAEDTAAATSRRRRGATCRPLWLALVGWRRLRRRRAAYAHIRIRLK